MNFKDIFRNSFLEAFTKTEVAAGEVIVILLCTCLVALYIFWVYRLLTRKTFYSKNFNISLAALSVITAIVILTVQSNIVLSLGMVGALSIVRFRTAIKEPLDIAFLFWAIAVGIVLAAGLIPLAVFGSLVIGAVLVVFVNRKSHCDPYIVVLQCDGHASETAARDYLSRQTRRCVVKSKTVQRDRVELNLEIRLKGDDTDFINVLAGMDGVSSAVLVSYNGDYLG